MAERLSLHKNAQVVLDSSGKGTVRMGPTSYLETWMTSVVSVLTDSNVKEPEFRMYLGPESPANFIGGTYTGSNDSDTTVTISIPTGQTITGVWTGGDPGATATMIVHGERIVG